VPRNDASAPALPRARRRVLRVLPLGGLLLATSGCGIPTFGFPTVLATEQSHRTLQIWKGSVVAALIVGAFVAALIFYAPFRYRKRSDELPRQVRYNLPIEVLYTVVPFVIVGILFFYTARDENYLNKLMPQQQFVAAKGVEVDVIAFKWNWKFEYPGYGTAVAGSSDSQAVLYLPAGRPVRFVEQSKDVIHSFWVVEFAFKRDVVPGRINQFEVTPDRVGTYTGRCAELCGYQHDRMNFRVEVVPTEQFDAKMAALKAQGSVSDSDAGVVAPGGNDSYPSNGVTNSEPHPDRSATAGKPAAGTSEQETTP